MAFPQATALSRPTLECSRLQRGNGESASGESSLTTGATYPAGTMFCGRGCSSRPTEEARRTRGRMGSKDIFRQSLSDGVKPQSAARTVALWCVANGYTKIRFKGLAKNTSQPLALLGLSSGGWHIDGVRKACFAEGICPKAASMLENRRQRRTIGAVATAKPETATPRHANVCCILRCAIAFAIPDRGR
jgi:hypothetical protein